MGIMFSIYRDKKSIRFR